MSLLASKTVLVGLRAVWFLATFSTFSFYQTPTQEYVVPRSIPTDDDIIL